MYVISDLTSMNGMTGNPILDTLFIGLAVLFFAGAGLFLPIWEYIEGRAPRRRRARTPAPARHMPGLPVHTPYAHR